MWQTFIQGRAECVAGNVPTAEIDGHLSHDNPHKPKQRYASPTDTANLARLAIARTTDQDNLLINKQKKTK